MSDQLVDFLYDEEEPKRLDKVLTVSLPDFSRSRLQSLIKDGKVTVNGVPAHKTGQVVEKRDHIQVLLPAPSPTHLIPEAIPLDIIFENDDLLVINKPAGLVVHPAAGHDTGTLVHAVLAHVPELEGVGGEQRPGIVHRLDKDTSGLILVAKNDKAHHFLQDQFSRRKVNKVYLALVDGHPPTPAGRIEAAIGRDHKMRQQMAIVTPQKGREAASLYRTLETFPEHTLLEVKPETGRTHQIRLHMAFLGCPVAGDSVYGKRHSTIPVDRHFLHAARLDISIPGEKDPRTFEAPLPPELVRVLEELRQRK